MLVDNALITKGFNTNMHRIRISKFLLPNTPEYLDNFLHLHFIHLILELFKFFHNCTKVK